MATYARTVAAALAEIGDAPLLLDDATRGRFGEASGAADRARRWLRARIGASVTLAAEGNWLRAHDVFRLAQARFDRSGVLLILRAPGPPGIMHWTYPIPARVEGWVNLYTIHDVIPLTNPGLSDMPAAPLRARLTVIAESADRLVTVSETSRREIAAALKLPPGRITNCGSAVESPQRGDGTLPQGLASGGYYLFVGMVEPRKNLARIVAAWRASATMRPLVIAGPDGDAGIDLTGVRHVGYLPRPALHDLIAGACALVFPTLEEGFGLPVIEAMALGTPVITSDRGALAETAGAAAVQVNPKDIAAIADAIRRIDRDDALCRLLTAQGRERASDFSLSAFGNRLTALYAEFAGASPSRP